MTLQEARHILKIHTSNRRVINQMRTRGESYSPSWLARVEARIVECKAVITAHEGRQKPSGPRARKAAA